METLTFNQHGQWNLVKTQENGRPTDADFLSYKSSNREGRLPEDRGHRGELHNPVPSKSQKHNSKNKMLGKVPIPVSSQYADNHPSQSNIS